MFSHIFINAFLIGGIAGIILWLWTKIKNKLPRSSNTSSGTYQTLFEISTWGGIILVLIGWLKGAFAQDSAGATLLVIGILLIVGNWIIPLILKNVIDKHPKSNIPQETTQEIAEETDTVPIEETKPTCRQEKKKPAASFLAHLTDDKGNGWILQYQYERDLCLYGCNFEDLIDQEGEEITFRQEPENTYDPCAVAVYLDDTKIGYIFKGRTQEMTNDWLKRDLVVGGLINSIDEESKEVTYQIAYYVPDSAAQSKVFSLIATSKKDFFGNRRSENIIYCKIGDELVILSDYDTYTVYSAAGDELGELGASFRSWAEKITYNTIAGVIDDIYDDENGNPKMKVKIMLI